MALAVGRRLGGQPMTTFSITEAAFAGFRAVARRPSTLGWWFGFALLAMIVEIGAVGLLMGSALVDLIRASAQSAEPSSAVVLSFIGRFFLGLLLLLPIAVAFAVMRVSAANRAILRPQDSRFGYLRLGVEELRVLAVLLVIFALQFAVQMVISIVMSLVLGGMMAAAAVSGSTSAMMTALALQFLTLIPTYAAIIFINVKFSLAVPQTMDTGAINIGGSWALTKGRFWPILGVYLIDYVVAFGVGIVVMLLLFATVAVVGVNLASMGSQFASNPVAALQAMGASLLPAAIFAALVFAASSAVTALLTLCPGPAIYRAITVNKEAEVF